MITVLETRALDITVGDRQLVRGLDLQLPPGSLVAMLGQNGTGKTLTLHTLSALRSPAGGTVHIGGRNVAALSPRERALRLGLLLQQEEDPFPTTVMETVLMGRHAHLGLWQWEKAEDRCRASSALTAVGLAGFEDRLCQTLSGGERRRVAIAMLLVQDPDILLLDEPLNHLDPKHQFMVLDTLEQLAGEGRSIVASLHDPALAMRHFTAALLLHGDGNWAFGPADELLNASVLARLYEVDFDPYQGPLDRVMLPVSRSKGARPETGRTPRQPVKPARRPS